MRALIDEFSTFWERAGDPPDPDSPLISQLLTDPLRTRVVEGFAGRAAEGYRYDGTYTIDIDQVLVDGDSAIVSACAIDGTTGYNPDGSMDSPPQGSPTDYAFTVRRTADGWRISSFTKFEESPCDLA